MPNKNWVGAAVGRAVAATVVGMSLIVGAAGTAFAGTSIPWTWNSDDEDVEGRFLDVGEHVQGIEDDGPGYIDYYVPYTGDDGRWYIPGGDDGSVHDLNLDYAEGHYFNMKVCQYWSYLPDDCTGTLVGIT